MREKEHADEEMHALEANGPEVSAIGSAAWHVGLLRRKTDEPESLRTIHRALDLG